MGCGYWGDESKFRNWPRARGEEVECMWTDCCGRDEGRKIFSDH